MYSEQQVDHEGAVRSAFQNLLANTAKSIGWVLVPELTDKFAGKLVRPDGTLKDKYSIPRGYWEAKDTDDDLDAEIGKKIRGGYPLSNIIFEDTRQAVLFQNGREFLRKNLTDPKEVAELLNAFYGYVEPNYEGFDQAVEKFKERVPELAKGLNEIIKQAHENNPLFQNAFDNFFQLCQNSLNPNISRDAVDEMLIQHLLTERLIRKIFNNPDFTSRNVIAVEVEKVISALTLKAFSRAEFLSKLDPFYVAIENAATDIVDFKDKQHFLNKVYESFFQGYSVKIADTHGIVYTPQPIVDFMCASVAEVLKTEFGKDLTDEDVFIIDPATGTGSFIANLLHRMDKKNLPRMYRRQLFANEVMLLPYYIASLNIEHVYYELTGSYEPFDGLCFVDTLDLVAGKHGGGEKDLFITEANTRRIVKERESPITVIIGNPPYNMGQQNENDNNKNREYEVIDHRIADTYARDSKATLKNKLYDPYVKFFRWATDRLGDRDGIICFVSNNSFIGDFAFDGMRKHLANDFQKLFLLDLKGNVRKDSMRDGIPIGEKHTIFGLAAMVGVNVALLIRKQPTTRSIDYFEVDWKSTREEKFNILRRVKNVTRIPWQKITPDEHHTWLIPEKSQEFRSFIPISSKKAKKRLSLSENTIFQIYSLGILTARDDHVYDFYSEKVSLKAEEFTEIYNKAVDVLKRKGGKIPVENMIDVSDRRIKWTWRSKESLSKLKYCNLNSSFIRHAIYRPFTKQYVYFSDFWIERRYKQHLIFPIPETERENRVILLAGIAVEKPFYSLMSDSIPNYSFVGFGSGCQCFPFYFYNEDGSNRRENITDWAFKNFHEHYSDNSISKWDIFYYVYGLLHHPGYRTTFADNLKRDLPHIPYAPDFWSFSKAGKEMSEWHLNYEKIEPYKLKYVYAEDKPLSYRVEDKMRFSKDKTELVVNPSLTLAGIPPETFGYRLGNRSALNWVIDQYRIKKDKQGEIISDPNRREDEQYIVCLVGQVIRVSLETVEIVNGLPEKFY